jgi:hypothetical protein
MELGKKNSGPAEASDPFDFTKDIQTSHPALRPFSHHRRPAV